MAISTAQFGKCHEVPVWQTSPMGPFDAGPIGGGGFECFYGFIGGETNQYHPAIYEGTTAMEPHRSPQQILAEQKALGVVPPDTELTGRHDEIQAWTRCQTSSSRRWPVRWR